MYTCTLIKWDYQRRRASKSPNFSESGQINATVFRKRLRVIGCRETVISHNLLGSLTEIVAAEKLQYHVKKYVTFSTSCNGHAIRWVPCKLFCPSLAFVDTRNILVVSSVCDRTPDRGLEFWCSSNYKFVNIFSILY